MVFPPEERFKEYGFTKVAAASMFVVSYVVLEAKGRIEDQLKLLLKERTLD